MAVKITLTDVGSSISATLELYSNQTGVWTYIEDVPTATLIAGYVFTPPVGASGYQVRDIGGCGTILEFYCTTTTTTTIGGLGTCYNIIVPDEDLIVDEYSLYIDYVAYENTSISRPYTEYDDVRPFEALYFETNLCSMSVPSFRRNGLGINLPSATITVGGYGCTDNTECPIGATTTSTTTIPPTTTTSTTEDTTTTTTTSTIAPTTTTTTTEEGTTTTTTTIGE